MITFAYADNSETVTKSLANFAAAISDQGEALREIADDFREMMAERFASEGRAEGTPWAERKSRSRVGAVRPSTGSGPRAKPRGEPPLLIRTGALRDSLTRRGAAGSFEELDETTLALGSRMPYAIFHQLGTRHMPARPLIVLTEARAAKWTEVVRGAIERRTTLLGLKELGGTQS